MKQWIYGRNTIRELITNHKNIYELVFLKGNRNDDLMELAKKNNIKYRVTDNRQFSEKAGKGNHQGVMALIDGYDYTPLEDILSSIPKGKQPLLVMLDGLEDPHNLGAILRTCDATEVDGVIIGKNRSVGLTPTVAKVSTGAIDYVPVAQVTNLSRTLDKLKKEGYWAVACENEKAQDYREVDYNMPTVLVIGSEGYGISQNVKKHCDMNVILPMAGYVTSLNASVACAVLLYQVYHSRHPLQGEYMGELNFSELLFLTRCGEMKARDVLYMYFYEFVHMMTKKYHYIHDGLENEDIAQEAMLCFDHVLYAYREDMNTKLSTYIGLCTVRCIQSEIRKNRRTRGTYDIEVSLDSQIAYDDDRKFEEVVADQRVLYMPDSAYKIHEMMQAIKRYEEYRMNKLEQKVFQLIKDGYRKDEISQILCLDKRAVYNVVYRLLVKLREATENKK